MDHQRVRSAERCNNPLEQAHQPTRIPERMGRFRCVASAQQIRHNGRVRDWNSTPPLKVTSPTRAVTRTVPPWGCLSAQCRSAPHSVPSRSTVLLASRRSPGGRSTESADVRLGGFVENHLATEGLDWRDRPVGQVALRAAGLGRRGAAAPAWLHLSVPAVAPAASAVRSTAFPSACLSTAPTTALKNRSEKPRRNASARVVAAVGIFHTRQLGTRRRGDSPPGESPS